MLRPILAVLGFGLAAVSLAAPLVPDTHAVHEVRGISGARWARRDRVPGDRKLPVRIGLSQSNLDKGHEYLMAVSHPDSAQYGKHWTSEEVIEAFKPSDEAVEAVSQWLKAHEIEDVTLSDNKAWLAFDAPAHLLESLLHTEYFEHEDTVTGSTMPACDQYHVPQAIQEHIDYISPGIRLMAPMQGRYRRDLGTRGGKMTLDVSPAPAPAPATRQSASPRAETNLTGSLANCDVWITPACVAALYQIPAADKADPSNAMGIFEAYANPWDQLDLDLFFSTYTAELSNGPIPNGTHPINREIDGAVAETTNATESGAETMLDLCLAYPIVYPQDIVLWNADDPYYQSQADSNNGFLNTFLDAIDGSYCSYAAYGEEGDASFDPQYPDPQPNGYKGERQCGVYNSTNVLSISYGWQEVEIPIAYSKRQCNEWMKLGLQGVSVFIASGDAGVGAGLGQDSETGCLGPNEDIFNPTWPSNCPYVTSVGATKVYPGYTVNDPESAANDPVNYTRPIGGSRLVAYSSGGGFSNVYPIPEWQESAVATYFSDHAPSYKYYSALAEDAANPAHVNVTALAGDTGGIYNRLGRGIPDVAANGDNIADFTGGTLHAPAGTSASTPIFAAIINRINEERIAVGKGPVGFINPTLYANPQVLNDITNGTNPWCGTDGFPASEGWDPVTGLGTPNYPKMLELFMSMP